MTRTLTIIAAVGAAILALTGMPVAAGAHGNGTDPCQHGKARFHNPHCRDTEQPPTGGGSTECSDGIDNDQDGHIDMDDPGCESPDDDMEGPDGGGNGGGGGRQGSLIQNLLDNLLGGL